MNKVYKIMSTILLLSLIPFYSTHAQTPQYTYGISNGSNVFPLATTSSNKEQWFYIMSEFNPIVPAGQIDKIYIKRSTSSSTTATYTGFTVKMGMVPNTQTQFANNTYLTTLQTVVPSGPFSIGPGNVDDWIEIPLTTPFIYDGTSNLVVEMSQTTYSGSVNLRSVLSGTTNRRIHGGVNNPTGSLTTGPKDLGIDMEIAICDTVDAPPNWGLIDSILSVCINSDFTLEVTELISGTGGEYQFQSSSDGINWNNVGTPNTSGSMVINNMTQDTYFRVQWLCNGVVKATSAAIEILVVDPEILSAPDVTRCGTGSVSLNATGPNGSTIQWFDNSSGGTPIYQGGTFNTPTLTNSRSYWVAAVVDGDCMSDLEEVIVTIYPDIELNLPDTFNLCTSPMVPGVLDAGAHANNPNYLWDDGSTNRYREVMQAGLYWVEVSNEFGCTDRDSIYANIRLNPNVNLGADTTICKGAELILDAGGDGVSYNWNTGTSDRYLTVSSGGTYSVIVESGNGCVVKDSITVQLSNDEVVEFDGIHVTNLAARTFKFELINPQNAEEYFWSFGDGNYSGDPSPTHTYAQSGNYIVHVDVSNICGSVYDSISTHIVSVEEKEKERNIVIYPNPSRDKVTIENKTSQLIEEIKIFDVHGREMYKKDLKNNSNTNNITELDISFLPTGMYWIYITIENERIIEKVKVIK